MLATRVFLAGGDAYRQKEWRTLLLQAGYEPVATVGDGLIATRLVFTLRPDAVIIQLPLAGRDPLDLAAAIFDQRVAPVILVAERLEWNLLTRAKDAGVLALLSGIPHPGELAGQLEMAMASFRRIVEVEAENRRLKEQLRERALVEKAKALLAECHNLSEAEAHGYLRTTSMNNRVTMGVTARQVIRRLRQERQPS